MQLVVFNYSFQEFKLIRTKQKACECELRNFELNRFLVFIKILSECENVLEMEIGGREEDKEKKEAQSINCEFVNYQD
jgi:hypothetical protein